MVYDAMALWFANLLAGGHQKMQKR